MPNVQWRTPDDGQRNCPKHVEFLDKNIFGKISASVGFIKKEFVTMHGHKNIKLLNKPTISDTTMGGRGTKISKDELNSKCIILPFNLGRRFVLTRRNGNSTSVLFTGETSFFPLHKHKL